MNRQRKMLLAAAVAGIVGTFLPWISISVGAFGISASQSRNGFHGLGIFFFLLMVASAIVAAMGDKQEMLDKKMRLIVIGAGVVAFLSLIITYSSIRDDVGGGYGMASSSMGIGLILSFLASIGVAIVPILIKKPGESLSDDLSMLGSSLKSMQTDMKLPNVGISKKPDRMQELEKLIQWRNEGKITSEEYEDLKSKII